MADVSIADIANPQNAPHEAIAVTAICMTNSSGSPNENGSPRRCRTARHTFMDSPAVVPPPRPSTVAIKIRQKSMQRLMMANRNARTTCRVFDPSAQRVPVIRNAVF